MNRRTRAVSIPAKVKRQVEERDHGHCIFCGRPGRGEAHFISRAQGGLGIEENLLTVCRSCHDQLDNSTKRQQMLTFAEEHLRARYPYWDKSFLIYEKGIKTKDRAMSAKRNYEKMGAFEGKEQKNIDLTKPPQGFWFIPGGNNDTENQGEHRHNI